MERISKTNNLQNYINFKKILIFGSRETGKSSLVNRIHKKEYDMNYIPSECN
jgi:GTPase SAR1 family protein